MAFNPQGGISGSVLVDTQTIAFGKWSLDMKEDLPDVSNFTTGGFFSYVAGLAGATLTCEGPFDVGNMAIALGSSYQFTLGVGGSLTYVVTVIVDGLGATQDIHDAARIKLTGKVNGAFTLLLG